MGGQCERTTDQAKERGLITDFIFEAAHGVENNGQAAICGARQFGGNDFVCCKGMGGHCGR